MEKHHHMAATFIDSSTRIASHQLLWTGCSAGLGWFRPLLPDAGVGSRGWQQGWQMWCLPLGTSSVPGQGCGTSLGIGSSTKQVGWPGAPFSWMCRRGAQLWPAWPWLFHGWLKQLT